MTITVEPVINEPALLVSGDTKALVLADIHLGIEWGLYRCGFSIPSQIEQRLERIMKLVEQEDPDRIVLLGDVKHNVPQVSWQERDEIPYFIGSLAEKATVDIFPGNHDGGIEFLLPTDSDVNVYSARGDIIDGVGYFHGHTWPSVELLSAEHLIVAHNHPTVRFTDAMGYSVVEQVWIRARLEREVLAAHFKSADLSPGSEAWSNPDVVVVPAFNELCGGVAFNESVRDDLLGPIFSSGALDIDNSDIYLLDGTYLGILKNIRKLEETQSDRSRNWKSSKNRINKRKKDSRSSKSKESSLKKNTAKGNSKNGTTTKGTATKEAEK
ncbi:metallophosphoesterase [Methanococcoides methylutens]|uniref:metallophosphoesterase n=1 Tax=Methanococcoides methylutens TaxID=2226 RepID=UPI000AC1E82B|nr:metallophosphoesterase [Methanococcoides methylutens]